MPKIYKRNCNYCGKYYTKQNKEFCSKECFGKSGKNGIFKEGHKFIKGGEKGWITSHC